MTYPIASSKGVMSLTMSTPSSPTRTRTSPRTSKTICKTMNIGPAMKLSNKDTRLENLADKRENICESYIISSPRSAGTVRVVRSSGMIDQGFYV